MRFRTWSFRRQNNIKNVAHLRTQGQMLHELKHAHDLLDVGEFDEACKVFTHIGEQTRSLHLPQAPFLLMQAAKAQLELGNSSRAFSLSWKALSWLQQAHRWVAFFRLGKRAANAFEAAGYPERSKQIRALLISVHEGVGSLPPDSAVYFPGLSLPEKCPYCGGSIDHRLQVASRDGAILCEYCGSYIKPC
jgi:hypothetical protein